MQHFGKKICAILLALCMLVGFVPLTAQAALLSGEDYITQQLYLGEDLVLHLRGDVPEEFREGSTATVTYAGTTDTYTIQDMTAGEDGLYDLPVELAVAQMTENINLVLKAKYLGMDMEAINEDYSIREYLKTLIEGNYTRETKALAQELLNYGAWAQKYFEYNTDDLANRGYDITPAYAVPAASPAAVQEGRVSGIQFYGTSVRFLSKTAVRFYFQADSAEGYTFTVDGEEYAAVYSESEGKYYIEVGGINPQEMTEEITVAVTDGSKTLTVAYAPISYFIRNYNKTSDENFKGLMAAAYSYFMAAQNFAGVTDTGKLTFSYKSGTANSISVNTNLSAETPLADFTLTENGCIVNEDACDLKASNVSMANVDGTIVLTFNFAQNFTAGQVYSLQKNAFFAFTDNNQYALADNYLFQFNGTSWTLVQAAGKFTEGVDFEAIGNTLLFSGEGPLNKAATVQRVAHNTEIPALANGGDYALKLTHADSAWPTFRIYFGEELEKGTTINFMAFGIIYGDSQYDYSLFEFAPGGDATVQFACGNWTQLTMTLKETAEYVDMYWNIDRAGLTEEGTPGAVYIDNFVAYEPVEAEGDFLEGVDFEAAGNIALFSGLGEVGRDAVLVRAPYANAGIPVPANGGDYALKLTHSNNYWPVFRINFGETLPAGTTLTFDAYTRDVTNAEISDVSIFEYYAGGEATAQYYYNSWNTLSITLAEACDHLDLVCTMDRWSQTDSAANVEVYLDNFKATKPAVRTGDIEEGLDFEDAGNALWFEGVGGNNAWRDATLQVVEFEGDNALKITCASSQWPTFRINFGKTLEAGTLITFDAYTNDTSGIRNTVSIFEYVSGGEATAQYYHGSWNTLTITLASDCDHIDLSCNMDRWSEPGPANLEVYIDNVKAAKIIEPSGDFTQGIDFETEGNELRFTGTGNASTDATVERVTYEALGIEAPENGGSYAVKISHNTNEYPTFRIDFGKTLKKGTTIKFDAYASTDGNAIALMDSTWTQAAYLPANAWRTGFTWEITLSSDCDHIDMLWERRGASQVPSYIVIDNIVAEEPAVVPCGDFTKGVDFETEGNELRFTATGNANSDATIERVSYADLGIDAPENGGSYAVKISHNTNEYPTFRIDFGKTLKKGTTIKFDAYASTDGNAIALMDSTWTQAAYLPANAWRTGCTWEITLSSDCSYIDMLWERRGASQIPSYIIMDNIVAVEPDPTIEDGLTFDHSNDISYFTGAGGGNEWRDASFEIVSFDGDNALKMTCASSQWPTFRINFGQTLNAGTTITFDAYTNDTAGIRQTVTIFEYVSGGEATVQYYHGSWNTLTITLAEACDHIDLMCNMDRWSEPGPANIEVYMDNFKAVEPGQAFIKGVDFDSADHIDLFTGVGGGNAWRDASFEIVSFDGDNALKLTCPASQWPTFRINFGKTLKAGTTITFDAYTNDTSGIRTTVSIFEYVSGGEATVQYYHGSWNTLTITLANDCDYIDLMCNMDRWSEPGPANLEVYMDNFKAVEA